MQDTEDGGQMLLGLTVHANVAGATRTSEHGTSAVVSRKDVSSAASYSPCWMVISTMRPDMEVSFRRLSARSSFLKTLSCHGGGGGALGMKSSRTRGGLVI